MMQLRTFPEIPAAAYTAKNLGFPNIDSTCICVFLADAKGNKYHHDKKKRSMTNTARRRGGGYGCDKLSICSVSMYGVLVGLRTAIAEPVIFHLYNQTTRRRDSAIIEIWNQPFPMDYICYIQRNTTTQILPCRASTVSTFTNRGRAASKGLNPLYCSEG